MRDRARGVPEGAWLDPAMPQANLYVPGSGYDYGTTYGYGAHGGGVQPGGPWGGYQYGR